MLGAVPACESQLHAWRSACLRQLHASLKHHLPHASAQPRLLSGILPRTAARTPVLTVEHLACSHAAEPALHVSALFSLPRDFVLKGLGSGHVTDCDYPHVATAGAILLTIELLVTSQSGTF
eukprot:3581496-Pleurochrysis_carterae.AAC.1